MFLGSSRCLRESGSPWIIIKKKKIPHLFFFFFCHTVNVTAILAFCITTQKERRKELRLPLAVCLNGFCKGGSVIFGFHLVWRCLSAAFYFIRNQSLMLQENSPIWTQSHQKWFSLKENLMKCKRKVWKQEANFESQAVPWVFASNIGIFPYVNGSLLAVTSVTTLLPLPTNDWKKRT